MTPVRTLTFFIFVLAVLGCADNAADSRDAGHRPNSGRRSDAGRVDGRGSERDGARQTDAPPISDGGSRPDSIDDAAPSDAETPRRRVSGTVVLGANGISSPLDFVVPPNTRSVTVVAEGAPDKLYALAALRTGDGVEQVGIDTAASYGAMMEQSYNSLQIGQMPGNLYQSIRLGTYTLGFPYAPGQMLVAGPSQMRIASNATNGNVKVTILMPEDDGASVLHLNVLAVSSRFTIAQPPAFLMALQAIFDQIGIQVVIDSAQTLAMSGFERITESTEPQESPSSMSAQLAALAGMQSTTDALNIMIVDSLPFGIGGLSLGTPGPPLRSSYYFGVIIAHGTDATMARVIAHEVCHFMALQHVENEDTMGQIYPDPIDDTEPGQGNLMENGTVLTAGQRFALSRSALLHTQ